jgi:hypothetical protein
MIGRWRIAALGMVLLVGLGVATDATTAADDVAWTARGATPRPLAPGVKAHRVAIRPEKITGRRFRWARAGG